MPLELGLALGLELPLDPVPLEPGLVLVLVLVFVLEDSVELGLELEPLIDPVPLELLGELVVSDDPLIELEPVPPALEPDFVESLLFLECLAFFDFLVVFLVVVVDVLSPIELLLGLAAEVSDEPVPPVWANAGAAASANREATNTLSFRMVLSLGTGHIPLLER